MATKKEIKEILNLALPAVGEMLLYMVVWVIDTMMVGQFGGKDSVSAVGLASEIIYTFSNIFVAMGISIGVTSYVARSIGAKDFETAEKYASQGIFLGFIVALFISLILVAFAENFLIIASATGNVLFLGKIYIKIASIGIFFNMLMNVLNAVLRAQGNTKTPHDSSKYSYIYQHFIGLDFNIWKIRLSCFRCKRFCNCYYYSTNYWLYIYNVILLQPKNIKY